MLSRREVLELILATIAAPKTAKKSEKRGIIIGPGYYQDEDTKQKAFVLALVDLDAAKPKREEIALDFFAHGVTPNPKKPTHAVLLEKKGPGACEVDLRARKVLRKIPTTPDRRFYGHGAWAADASVIYVVESVIDEAYKGVITVRDGKTFEVKSLFPTYGASPHDCRLIDNGKVLAITNGGGDIKSNVYGSITYVEVASQKLLEKIDLDPQLNAGHLSISSGGDLAVVSAPRDGIPNPMNVRGGVSLRRAGGGKFATMNEPGEVVGRMLGETLSVAIHEPSGHVAATNPMGQILTIWSLKTGALVKHFDLPHPRGVSLTLDGKNFVVSYAAESILVQIDATTLELVEGSKFEPSYMSGSHVITHSFAV